MNCGTKKNKIDYLTIAKLFNIYIIGHSVRNVFLKYFQDGTLLAMYIIKNKELGDREMKKRDFVKQWNERKARFVK